MIFYPSYGDYSVEIICVELDRPSFQPLHNNPDRVF